MFPEIGHFGKNNYVQMRKSIVIGLFVAGLTFVAAADRSNYHHSHQNDTEWKLPFPLTFWHYWSSKLEEKSSPLTTPFTEIPLNEKGFYTTDGSKSTEYEGSISTDKDNSSLQHGTSFENFKRNVGLGLGAVVSIPIVALILLVCCCYCICRCCCGACQSEQKVVVMNHNMVRQEPPQQQPPTQIIVHQQTLPYQQYPPPYQPCPPPPQFLSHQQMQYSPTGAYDNPNCYQPTAPPDYNLK